MLRGLCNTVNVYLANHKNENEADFIRNIIANLISGLSDLKGFKKV